MIVNPQSGPTFILNEKTIKLSDLPEGIEDEEFQIISSGKELYTLLMEGYKAWADGLWLAGDIACLSIP